MVCLLASKIKFYVGALQAHGGMSNKPSTGFFITLVQNFVNESIHLDPKSTDLETSSPNVVHSTFMGTNKNMFHFIYCSLPQNIFM